MPGTLVHRRRTGEQLPDVMYPNGICVPGLMRLFVDANGVLHACERVNHHMPLGTVRHGFDLDRIVGYIDQYRALSQDDCSRCWAVRYCRLCFKSALGRRLSLRRKRNDCKLLRRYWLGIFALYWSIQGRNPLAVKYFESVKLS